MHGAWSKELRNNIPCARQKEHASGKILAHRRSRHAGEDQVFNGKINHFRFSRFGGIEIPRRQLTSLANDLRENDAGGNRDIE